LEDCPGTRTAIAKRVPTGEGSHSRAPSSSGIHATAEPPSILSDRYFFYWTCPVKLAQRLKERFLPGVPAPAGIPPRWANRALYLASRLEQTLLAPFPIPFGSSLLIVGGRAADAGR
jgi:hypothetical protein